jgi:ABC-type transport system involved in multi-copper enzyme maturation permease subunit
MLKALVWKESRELAPLVAMSIFAELLFFLPPELMFGSQSTSDLIPFVSSRLTTWILVVGGAAGIAFGFWQTVGESMRGTYHFLLHRPVTRETILVTKLGVGVALVLLLTGVPILGYALWAARPATHASPFYWAMTAHTWQLWIQLPMFYFAAFLSGLRPAAWLGSRAIPLASSLPLSLLLFFAGFLSPWLQLAGSLAIEAFLVYVIFFVLSARDFS